MWGESHAWNWLRNFGFERVTALVMPRKLHKHWGLAPEGSSLVVSYYLCNQFSGVCARFLQKLRAEKRHSLIRPAPRHREIYFK
jgi:hypothetical protein